MIKATGVKIHKLAEENLKHFQVRVLNPELTFVALKVLLEMYKSTPLLQNLATS